MSESESTIDLPADGNYQRAKRDILRRGVATGKLRMSEIRAALPPPHISIAELDLFLFSLSALDVEVIDDTGE